MASSEILSTLTFDKGSAFIFEASLTLLTGLYVLVFIFGSRYNLNIARSVSKKLSAVLSEQFAKTQDENGKALTRDGMNSYWFHATGRAHTSGLTVWMELARRMDMFSYTSSFMGNYQADRAIFFLPVDEKVYTAPSSLFIFTRREAQRLKVIDDGAPFQFARTLASQVVKADGMPDDVTVMAEHAGTAKALISPAMVNDIVKYKGLLCSIHVTDRTTNWDAQSSNFNKLIRAEFLLPAEATKRDEMMSVMSSHLLDILDKLADDVIPVISKNKGVAIRKALDKEVEKKKQKERMKEAVEKRLEKKRAEEEAVGKMSAEKRKKHEAKKRKKELADKMRKKVVKA